MKKTLMIVIVTLIYLAVFPAGTENIMSQLGYSAGLTGKGETGYIFSDNAGAIKVNPAMLGYMDTPNVLWTHSELNYSQWNDYIAGGTSMETKGLDIGIGMAWNRLWIDGIPVTEEGDTIDSTGLTEIIYSGNTNMTLNEYGIGVSVGKCCLSGGILVKYQQGSLLEYSVKGIGADAGIMFKRAINKSVLNTVGLAVVIRDIAGTRLTWNTGYEEATSMTADIGAGISFDIPKLGENALNIEGMMCKSMEQGSSLEYKGGAELYILPMVPLRVGYNGSSVTAGIGLSTEHINVDYSFTGMNDLEPVHKISIGLSY